VTVSSHIVLVNLSGYDLEYCQAQTESAAYPPTKHHLLPFVRDASSLRPQDQVLHWADSRLDKKLRIRFKGTDVPSIFDWHSSDPTKRCRLERAASTLAGNPAQGWEWRFEAVQRVVSTGFSCHVVSFLDFVCRVVRRLRWMWVSSP
jgi:hypothetical protein